jgi:hypothetical protein
LVGVRQKIFADKIKTNFSDINGKQSAIHEKGIPCIVWENGNPDTWERGKVLD